VNVEECPDPMAGAVQVVQPHVPQVLPGKAVQAVPLNLGGEDGRRQTDHTSHTVITSKIHIPQRNAVNPTAGKNKKIGARHLFIISCKTKQDFLVSGVMGGEGGPTFENSCEAFLLVLGGSAEVKRSGHIRGPVLSHHQ